MELTGGARLAVTERERRRFGLDGPVGLRRKGRKEGERSGLGWKGKRRNGEEIFSLFILTQTSFE